jgi:hypothetical protein
MGWVPQFFNYLSSEEGRLGLLTYTHRSLHFNPNRPYCKIYFIPWQDTCTSDRKHTLLFPIFAPCLKAGKASFLTEIPTLTCTNAHLIKLPETSVNKNKRYPARNLQQTNNIQNVFACSDRCSTLKIELCFILVWPLTYATFFCQLGFYGLLPYEVGIF